MTKADEKINTAVILAGGLGTRMQKPTDEQVDLCNSENSSIQVGLKGMILANDGKSIFDSSLSNLIEAGIDHIVFVVNKNNIMPVRRAYDSILMHYVDVSYAIQDKPMGTANAVLAAEKHTHARRFIVMNYDNVYPTESIRLLLNSESPWSAVGYDRDALGNPAKSNLKSEKVMQCAVMQVCEDNTLVRIVEAAGKDQDEYASPEGKILISMSLFGFDNDIYDACRSIPFRERKPGKREWELPDAVQFGISCMSKQMKVSYSDEGVIDLTAKGDIEGARALTDGRDLIFYRR
jgi:dTDP-glucose pyrophosphorylase